MSRSTVLRLGLPLIACVALCYFFPLWHLRTLDESSAQTGPISGSRKSPSTAVDPATYVDAFWTSELRKGEGATEVTQLWHAFDTDPKLAKQDFGRQVGLGGASFFCVRGRGKVETIETDHCIVTIPSGTVPGESRPVCLLLDVIVGNTIRDATGVDVNEFSNSQDFNNVSTELNRRVEQEVIHPSKSLLKLGRSVEFVGCATIGSISDLDPLCLIPIRIDMLEPEAPL